MSAVRGASVDRQASFWRSLILLAFSLLFALVFFCPVRADGLHGGSRFGDPSQTIVRPPASVRSGGGSSAPADAISSFA